MTVLHAILNVYLDIRVFLGACTIQIAHSAISDLDFSNRKVNVQFLDDAVPSLERNLDQGGHVAALLLLLMIGPVLRAQVEVHLVVGDRGVRRPSLSSSVTRPLIGDFNVESLTDSSRLCSLDKFHRSKLCTLISNIAVSSSTCTFLSEVLAFFFRMVFDLLPNPIFCFDLKKIGVARYLLSLVAKTDQNISFFQLELSFWRLF